MFISQCEDKSLNLGTNKFKYNNGLEKNKLFVSNLPFATTKNELEEIFKPFGDLKEVRIVTFKSGKSKGLAYVEYKDEGCAAKAILQTDNMLIGEHQISVAISNPPKKNARDSTDESNTNPITSSLGSGNVKAGYVYATRSLLNIRCEKIEYFFFNFNLKQNSLNTTRSRGHMVALMPRSVTTKPTVVKSQANASNKDQEVASNQLKNIQLDDNDKTTTKPMSNADFRSILLNKN
jgi:RNA recognition motif-containing protein